MESLCVDQFISSAAQSLKPGYLEFVNTLNSSECRKEIDSLLNNRYDAHNASKGPLLTCLLLNLHRQSSLASQSKADLETEVESLTAHNARLLHEVQIANKKAMRYLGDLHSAESDLFAHKEELLRLRSERPASPQSFSLCDSGFSDSHSCLRETFTDTSHRRSRQFPTELKSFGTQADSPVPQRNRESNHLTSHLSDSDPELCSLSSRRYSVPRSSQSLTPDTFIPTRTAKGGTRTFQNCSATSARCYESDDSYSVSASQQNMTAAHNAHVHSNARFVSPSPERTSQSPRLEVLELIAKDMETFDPDNPGQDIEDYFTELDHNFNDLPHATQREKVKLVWKTSSKAVHKFIQSQPPRIRNDYGELRQALTEEFSSLADVTTSIVAALQIKHSRHESPRDFHKRLKHAFFQGKNAPDLDENSTFKSVFLQNLHPCIRTHVALMTREGNPSMHEIRKMTQVAWETVVTSRASEKLIEPGNPKPKVSTRPAVLKDHPQPRQKGDDKRLNRDTERSRHVQHTRRFWNTPGRSSRRPYSNMAQNSDVQPSGDGCSLPDSTLEDPPDSDSASDCPPDYGYTEHHSPQPRIRKTSKSHRARSSQ